MTLPHPGPHWGGWRGRQISKKSPIFQKTFFSTSTQVGKNNMHGFNVHDADIVKFTAPDSAVQALR